MSCRASGYDFAALDRPAINRAVGEAVSKGELRSTDGCWNAVHPEFGHWLHCHGNNANHLSGFHAGDSDGRTALELAGCASVLRLWRFLRTQPGLQNLRLDALAAECGVRETVTIRGVETITLDDYLSGRVWPDAAGFAFYPIDLHSCQGEGLDNRKLREGVVPTFGLGALTPAGWRRLLVAGRCLSSDRLANSALRVQATCMATGQAAGALAALSCREANGTEAVRADAVRALLSKHQAILPSVSAN